jgi:hypothetical protein
MAVDDLEKGTIKRAMLETSLGDTLTCQIAKYNREHDACKSLLLNMDTCMATLVSNNVMTSVSRMVKWYMRSLENSKLSAIKK